MANVVVTVAGRPYTMQCPDGEEEHLKELAKLLDTEVTRIRQSVGSIGDIRLLVMSGLMVADRLSEAMQRVTLLEEQVQGLKDARNNALAQAKAAEDLFARKLEEATVRLERAAGAELR
jgi:cell division protein ZapA